VKFLDYALAGIPTVCSDVPPYSDFVTDGQNGILCANTEDEWYQAIRTLVLSASRRTEMANAARQFAQSAYPMKHAADMWNEVLSSTRVGQGKQSSELLTTRGNIPLLLHRIITPYTYLSALRVLRTEGFGGVRQRLSRLI
jgi:hypothetical protein